MGKVILEAIANINIQHKLDHHVPFAVLVEGENYAEEAKNTAESYVKNYIAYKNLEGVKSVDLEIGGENGLIKTNINHILDL